MVILVNLTVAPRPGAAAQHPLRRARCSAQDRDLLLGPCRISVPPNLCEIVSLLSRRSSRLKETRSQYHQRRRSTRPVSEAAERTRAERHDQLAVRRHRCVRFGALTRDSRSSSTGRRTGTPCAQQLVRIRPADFPAGRPICADNRVTFRLAPWRERCRFPGTCRNRKEPSCNSR